MIYGNIRDLTQYSFLKTNPKLKTALDYLIKGEFPEPDKRVDLEEGIFLSLASFDTKEFDINCFEAHYHHLDIHYVVDGVEEMYVAPFDTMINKSDYKEDIIFGRCEDYQKIIMKKGDYCITFPEDAHKPSCGHGNHLTKICVKIPS